MIGNMCQWSSARRVQVGANGVALASCPLKVGCQHLLKGEREKDRQVVLTPEDCLSEAR